VGCATGTFLEALEERGWNVRGVEISAQAAAHATKSIQGGIFVGELVDAGYPDEEFDLITFWDVLEHLPDPRQALLEAARIARHSGNLVVSLPNLHSWEARLFGQNWAGWDIPRHLWWFPRPALVRLLDETGWVAQEFICRRGRHWMLVLSLQLWLQEQRLPAALRRSVMALVRSLPVKVMLMPYFAFAEWRQRASIIVVFAKRKDSPIA
jgi:SAM-dependent methyltransferase